LLNTVHQYFLQMYANCDNFCKQKITFMRKTITSLFVLLSCVTNAQFSVQPQVGLENSRTSIKSSEFASFSPMGRQFAPRLAVRMSYKFKAGHGAFLGVATGKQAVAFKFTDPQAARTTYTATEKGLQLHLEGGYQYATRPIALSSANRSGHRSDAGVQRKCVSKPGCGQQSSTSHCRKTSAKTTTANKGWYVRIVPSAGLALMPSGVKEIETETKGGQTTYEYKAGWNTAFIAGTAFEFGSLKQSRFVVNVNFLKGFGNKQNTINTVVNGKPNATSFRSNASGFNVSLGIPVNLKQNKNSLQKTKCVRSYYLPSCGKYRANPM
jgi:hypothetical protein